MPDGFGGAVTRLCGACNAWTRPAPVCDHCDRADDPTCGAAVKGARCDEPAAHGGEHVARAMGREARRWER